MWHWVQGSDASDESRMVDECHRLHSDGIEGEQWNPDDRGQTEDWFPRLHHLPTQRQGDLREACGMHRPSHALPDHVQAEPGSLGAVLFVSSGSRRVHNNPTASQFKSAYKREHCYIFFSEFPISYFNGLVFPTIG